MIYSPMIPYSESKYKIEDFYNEIKKFQSKHPWKFVHIIQDPIIDGNRVLKHSVVVIHIRDGYDFPFSGWIETKTGMRSWFT